MIVISVVSGTYNRLNSVQRMVQSVRSSIGPYRASYEVVLVDGGSTDGTIEWVRQQSDIKLIEHGALHGAVRAFNDGAKAARGMYVILANDDITFLDQSIFTSIEHMQNNPLCGIGCFYQDRHGRDWHVETMPVVVNGQQSAAPYGQVCIVPKWLGDHVGWWGDYLHTYGGDNELSCNVYRLGFQVTPIAGSRINDHHIDDELRTINNVDGASDPRAVRGHHPDSYAWGRKWQQGRLMGVTINTTPLIAPPRPMRRVERVLYLPIYEAGWEHLQYDQKRGLREAFEEYHITHEYDYIHRHKELGHDKMVEELCTICDNFKPTLIVTQLHNPTEITAQDIKLIRRHAPFAFFVNWNGDFWPDNLTPPECVNLNAQFDLVGLVNREVVEQYNRQGIESIYWQIGWEPDGIIGDAGPRSDVVFLGNCYSTSRRKLASELRELSTQLKFELALYGSWPDGWAKGQTTYDFRAGCEIYRGSKLALGDSQWPESGFVSNRIFQILCTGGCALLHQYFKDYELLGLKDGFNCIIWRDETELHQKIQYYLTHERERQLISLNGMKLAHEQHSFKARVHELMIEVEQRRLSVDVIDWR